MTILIEAEQFANYGGWVLDPQFMDQMGSPYLLAHGLGRPVADAVTTFTAPKAGTYRVWVRTYNWVGPWQSAGGPGAFQLNVDGTLLPVVFGDTGVAWGWQDGGVVSLRAGEMRLGLHDLTGFEGRCDAILFSSDTTYIPPNDAVALQALRRKWLGLPDEPEDGGSFDLVVAGGGLAGMCAAVGAARCGLSVALIQDRPVFGGNNSSEVRVGLGGEVNLAPYPHIGDLMAEIDALANVDGEKPDKATPEYDHLRAGWMAAEPRVTSFMLHRVMAAETEKGVIRAVIAQDVVSGRRVRLRGTNFADCTGDGDLGFAAGAEFDVTLKGHMGPTNIWRAEECGQLEPFPRCPWAIDLSTKPFPGRGEYSSQWARPGLNSLGQWFWENGFNLDPITDAERMRDTNFRAMYGAWDALKNVDGMYPMHRLGWAGYAGGKRESRRLLGDVIVSRDDLYEQRAYPDGCVPCTWHMDLHVPHRDYQAGFEGEEFISWCVGGPYPRPFWLPYRALYSRTISNLFMAGRDVSVTHEALGTVRVMRTCGMMGEVVGMAAALCARLKTTPRKLYEDHWDLLKQALNEGQPSALFQGK